MLFEVNVIQVTNCLFINVLWILAGQPAFMSRMQKHLTHDPGFIIMNLYWSFQKTFLAQVF